MEDIMNTSEKKEAYDEIRKINNKIYNIKLTFLELEALENWLASLKLDEIGMAILERVSIACDEAKQTGDSV